MLTKLRRQRSEAAARSAAGIMHVTVTPTIRTVLNKLGGRWRCSTEEAGERVITLSMTGWRAQHGEIIDRLSAYVQGADEPFYRTCLMLRNHFESTEAELGEMVREADRVAWLEMLLESLQTMRGNNQPARLIDLLAGNAVGAEAGM